MYLFKYLILCTLTSIVASFGSCDYDCNGTTNLMCKNSCQPTGRLCGINAMPIRILYEEIWEILRVHNFHRTTLSLSFYGNPQPDRINTLSYYMPLAESAACAVNMCRVDNINIEFCVKTSKMKSISQNYHLYTPSRKEKGVLGVEGITSAIGSWNAEHKFGKFNNESILKWHYNESNKHFTNLCYGDTRYVGCAATTVGSQILFGCHYYPAFQSGDYLYMPGGAVWCSKCDRQFGSCDVEYASLCGYSRLLTANYFSRSSPRLTINTLILIFIIFLKCI